MHAELELALEHAELTAQVLHVKSILPVSEFVAGLDLLSIISSCFHSPETII